MLDTGSLSNVISRALLDKLGLEIDRPAQSAMIDINRNRTVPLGIVTNLQIEAGDATWTAQALVSESHSYAIILGNAFLSQTKATLDYSNRKCIFQQKELKKEIPMSCWQKFPNPLIPEEIIPSEPFEEDKIELEEEDELDEEKTFINQI